MRSSVTLLRSLRLFFKKLKLRSIQVWKSDRAQHTRDWASTKLKRANSRIRAAHLARPGAFWAVALGSLPLLIVFALFMSGNTAQVWPPLATFGTALGATIVAIATLMRHFAQTDADRQRRIVETFSRTVEQLGSDKLEVRVGAIFALERLSKESTDDYWTIMEVLAAFVRDRMRYTTIMDRLSKRSYFLWQQAGQPEGRSEEFWAEALRLELLEETPTDIAAIFTVIERRSDENRRLEIERDWRFDFRATYLRNVLLKQFQLQRANLSEAHLERASLVGVHLEQADLYETHLEGAFLDHAHLERAFLFRAHLERPSLWRAHLEGANLRGAHLEEGSLREAHLEGADLRRAGAHLEGADLRRAGAHLERADLRGAHFEGADLRGAHLEGANLREAHLEGADLSTAQGLTDDQLVFAHGDRKTKLPEGITRPKSWRAASHGGSQCTFPT
jgi:uncharacterized protein YjbI with pentapeptide repeats